MKIGNDIYYVGVNDHQVDLFEGQYVVPNGMSYNSYVIKDEKIAVMDTVDANFTEEWLGKVAEVLDGVGEFAVGGVKHVCKAGEALVMPATIPHAVYAVERFKMLLTVVFPVEK